VKKTRFALRGALGGLVLALAAAGCAGHGGSRALPSAQAPPAAPQVNAGSFGYDAAFVQSSQYLGPAKFGRLAFDVAVRWRNPQGLAAYAQAASDPSSALYRRFLAPQEIADRFLATQADYDAAAAYLRGNGIDVGTWRQRMVLHVSGTQAQLERAFGTTFGVYRNGSETFVAPATRPQLPAGVPIVGSVDIVKRTQRYAHSFVRASGGLSNGRMTGYAPQQIAAAFDFTGAYGAGFTGAGITVGVIGTGPVQVSGGGRIGDAEAYKTLYRVNGASSVTLVASPDENIQNGASGFTTPPPVTPPCNVSSDPSASPSVSPAAGCNPEDYEAQIDTEQVAALARDANVQFFLAYNPNDGCPGIVTGNPCPAGTGHAYQGLLENEQELQTAIDANTADVLSLSYGGPEPAFVGVPGNSPPYAFDSNGGGLDPGIFAALAAEGIAVFVSSGDAGANECRRGYPAQADSLCVSYPATDPSVVAVGGVTTPLDGAGRLIGPLTAWGLQTSGGFGGTGGGVSRYFGLPAFQQGVAGVTGTDRRNIPDLALEGDAETGVAVLAYADRSFGGAQLGSFGGTSVAAPEMAAMWALVLQACKQTSSCGNGPSAHPYRLGNPNPLFYRIAKNAAQYAATFYDVTYGNNAQVLYCQGEGAADPANCPTTAPSPPTLAPGYNAGIGYDLDTGLGVPFARNLIRAIVGV
jgi:kumamolisin